MVERMSPVSSRNKEKASQRNTGQHSPRDVRRSSAIGGEAETGDRDGKLDRKGTTKKHFTVDARTVLQLGRQGIKDHTTALVELVKNAYDADATTVLVEIRANEDLIRVLDNGCGMTEAQFDRTWLRIGYSIKRRAKRSPSGRRRVVGEKGVGRISADRLGATLALRTHAEGSPPFSATLSWDAFDVDGKDLSNVNVTVRRGDAPDLSALIAARTRAGKTSPSEHMPKRPSNITVPTSGTELVIRHLRQAWSRDDVQALFDELSTLVSPFQEAGDFQILVSTDVKGAPSGSVESSLPDRAELELRARLHRNVLTYRIIDRTNGGKKAKITSGKRRWVDLVQRTRDPRAPRRTNRGSRTGPAEVRLLYFPKRVFSARPGGLSVRDLRDRAVGVRIYRDAVRVRPYGDSKSPEGDWLGLAERKGRDPAGVSRKSYRIPPTELGGAVFIGRDRNRRLEDSAGREGLIHNEAFNDLRALTLGSLTLLEEYRHRAYAARQNDKDEPLPALTAVEGFANQLRTIEREWQEILAQATNDPRMAASRATEAVTATVGWVRSTRSSIDTLVEQTRLFRGLSTLGIAASVFGHETQTNISMCVGNIREGRDELTEARPDISLVRRALETAYENARKVSAWGAFAVARVRHEKRKAKDIRLDELVAALTAELTAAYAATNTTIQVVTDPVTIHGYEMDLEAVILNLLTNAYTFAQESNRVRAIRVELSRQPHKGRDGARLIIADSGPGVPVSARETIWEPLFTTKRDAEGHEIGTGLGLAIIDSIVRDVGGMRAVDTDPALRGARFTIWLPVSSST